MTTSTFPTSLDSFVDPTASDTLGTTGVKAFEVIAKLHDAVEKLEAKVGIDSSAVATSLDFKVANRQPLDADLTAIAALTTTAYGRGLLTDADAAAFTSRLTGLLGSVYAVLASVPFLVPAINDYVGIPHTARGVSNATADRLEYAPFRVTETMTFDRIAAEVTTGAANGVLRLGIYNGANGRPTTRVLDAGTVDGSTTGFKAITISQQLTPGLYFLACAAQGSNAAAPNYRRTTSAVESVTWTDPSGSANPQAFTETGVTGALPATATVGSTNQGAFLIWLRRSA